MNKRHLTMGEEFHIHCQVTGCKAQPRKMHMTLESRLVCSTTLVDMRTYTRTCIYIVCMVHDCVC